MTMNAQSLGGTTISLDLARRGLGAAEVTLLAGVLKSNTVLTRLVLDGNPAMGIAGCGAIAGALMSNNTLVELGLASNDLGAEGARVLSPGLGANQSLTAVDLSHNATGRHGVHWLCDAMESNQSLTSINLDGNALEGSNAAFYDRQLLGAALTANKRRQQYRASLKVRAALPRCWRIVAASPLVADCAPLAACSLPLTSRGSAACRTEFVRPA